MAQIRDIQLEMGMQPDQQTFADVRFSVEFSEAEMRRNMQYGLYVGLFRNDERAYQAEFETNGAYQTFMMPAHPGVFMGNGQAADAQFGMHFGNQDSGQRNAQSGLVCWIARESLMPSQTQTHHITRKTTFDLNRFPKSYNGFRAMVWVVPEIAQGQGWSKPQRLGQFFQPQSQAY
jgi:hypothetical protein